MRIRKELIIVLLLCATATVPAHAQMVSVNTADIKWGANPVVPGAKFAVIHGNPAEPGPFAYRIWFPADYNVAAHRHPVDEHVTVLWGTLYAGMGDKLDREKSTPYRAAGYFSMPANHAHYVWTREETLIQVQGVGPTSITFVDPAEDPRKK
jgi:hypothetical protein